MEEEVRKDKLHHARSGMMSLPALHVQIDQHLKSQRATKLYILKLHIPATALATMTYSGACHAAFARPHTLLVSAYPALLIELWERHDHCARALIQQCPTKTNTPV